MNSSSLLVTDVEVEEGRASQVDNSPETFSDVQGDEGDQIGNIGQQLEYPG